MTYDPNAVGLIFNVVHGSFVDGYGIRTTIFLKGCPLRGQWCCNPEGQSFQPQLRCIPSHCSGCGRCVEACPRQALSVQDGKVVVDWSRCDHCGRCVDSCWFSALELWGKPCTAREMFEVVRRDAPYYAASGGGLTIGGGEATCYPDFCLALMELCHGEGIPVAIDSCGYVTSPKGLEVLKQADLVLLDIKGIDPARHRGNTGGDNGVSWDTLRALEGWGQHVIIRIPVIPGYNEDELEEMARRLSPFRCIERLDLICYHEFGTSKYEEIGMTYSVDASPIPPERQQEILALFQAHGFQAQLGG